MLLLHYSTPGKTQAAPMGRLSIGIAGQLRQPELRCTERQAGLDL